MAVYAGETTRIQAALEDDDNLPTCPLPGSVTLEVRSEDELTVLLAAVAMNLIVKDQGTASSGTTTTLTDSTQAWNIDQWRGACIKLTGGTGTGQERRIKSNTATVLTIDTKQVVNEAPVGAFSPAPDNTTTYQLHESKYRKNFDVPTDQEDKTLVALIRAATVTGPQPYKSAEKVEFRVEGEAV